MNSIKAYFRPNAGPEATGSKPDRNGKVPSRDVPLVETAPHRGTNSSAGARGPSTPRPPMSRPASVHPDGDFRNNTPQAVDEIKNAVAISWVYQVQNENMWNGEGVAEGIVLRTAPRQFIACPDELRSVKDGLFDAACELNAKVRWRRNYSVRISLNP